MDRFIGKELDKRYDELKADPENLRSKAVIDLVLQAYISKDAKIPEKLNAEFRLFAIRQIRTFVFAGHDSTSSTICYILHLPALNPDALASIRAEHDPVFGTESSAATSMLQERPHLTNSLPYTTAVIKEAMRLFTPAGCTRAGKPNEDVVDDQGNYCPTENAII